jgi:formylglycine-generating enzyme required for sulfatase activity
VGNPGFRYDETHPVVCVSWQDAKAYAAWLSSQTDKTYRLLTEAEREYVARAGTTTPYWWGSTIDQNQANYDSIYPGGAPKGRGASVPVTNFAPNPWGLFNVHGKVWEWCEDIWHDDYNGAPADASAWVQGGHANYRVLRGGSWARSAHRLRSASRRRARAELRDNDVGFRLARTLAF